MQLVRTASATGLQFPDQRATMGLLQVIQEMGKRRSNPVIEVLRSRESFQQQHKYFVREKLFAGSRLCTYYHRHSSPDGDTREHGHFHAFIRVPRFDGVDWAHLAAIGMDSFGQPLRWFAVNRWVTGGPWVVAADLVRQVGEISEAGSKLSLLERWIVAMVRFYRPVLYELLEERDRALAQQQDRSPGVEVLEEREIYALAEHRIDLVADLQRTSVSFTG